jgi:AcrR family transcriptional regulator
MKSSRQVSVFSPARGFAETSMSEVARRQGRQGADFLAFKAKEELFLAVLNRLLEPYLSILLRRSGRWMSARSCASWCSHTCSLCATMLHPCVFPRSTAPWRKVPEELAAQVMKLYDGYRGLMVDIVRRARRRIFARATSRLGQPPVS